MIAEVYTRNPCPFCVRAKMLLESHNIEYTEIHVDEIIRETLMERVTQATISDEHPHGKPPRTVPQIFLDGAYIGGFDDLEDYFRTKDRVAE